MWGDSFVHASTPPLWNEMSGATAKKKVWKTSQNEQSTKALQTIFFIAISYDDVFLSLYVSLCGGKFAAIIIMMHILVNMSPFVEINFQT